MEPLGHPRSLVPTIRSRLVLLAAVLWCAAPALPGHAPAAPSPAARPVLADAAGVDPAPAPAPAPARPVSVPRPVPVDLDHATPVETTHVAIRAEGLGPDAADAVADVEGVARATTIQVGRLAVGDGGQELVVAAIDPVGYRAFAPQVVADTPGVWERLDEGAIAVTHEHAQRLALELGGDLVLGGPSGIALRVGAFATNGLPPIAEAVVSRDVAPGLGLDTVASTLLVGVDDGVDVAAVAARVGERVSADATVVPDPHAPSAVTPRAPSGDTVWDVLAGCESSGDWTANTGNGYYGGLQFLPESWWLVGGTGLPHEAPREEQIARAERLLGLQGWVAWPVCSIRVGLRADPGTTG